MASSEAPIDLCSDSESDDDLKRAIALSLQDQEALTTQKDDSGTEADTKSDIKSESEVKDEPKAAPSGLTGLLGLDRAQMEKERLARIAKRRRDAGEEDEASTSVAPPPAKRQAMELPRPTMQLPQRSAPRVINSSSKMSEAVTPAHIPFAQGVVKRTYAYGYPRRPDDIKIEEIFDRAKLQLAVLSSFQWDEDWLMSKLDTWRTKLLLVAYAADEDQKETMRGNVPSTMRFVFPPMNGPGAMHSKLQLLKYDTHLRVVIPTGNLVPYDWGESGVMENMVFIIDLPRLADGEDHESTSFSTHLGRFLEASGVPQSMVDSLYKYDFSRTKDMGFVYSIPGGHTDEARRRIGYCGLGSSISRLDLRNSGPIDIDMVCSSLGSIHAGFIQAIYNACQGDDGMTEFKARSKKSGQKTEEVQAMTDRFRIYFPKDKTVVNSRGGRGAGGTICAQAKWWRSSTFPRHLFRDCVNTREGLLMHSKLIFVRPRDEPADTNGEGAQNKRPFAYVGSANLSESAWGKMTNDRNTGKPKITCRNWECGVVLPITHSTQGDGLDVFTKTVPVPMKFPSSTYGSDEEPWFFMGNQ